MIVVIVVLLALILTTTIIKFPATPLFDVVVIVSVLDPAAAVAPPMLVGVPMVAHRGMFNVSG